MKIPFIAVLATLVPAVASAGVQFSSPGVASGVTDLVVGIDIFDVDFIGNQSSEFWSQNLDFIDETSAVAAAQALAAELNAANVESLALITANGNPFNATFVQVPYGDNGTNLLGAFLSFGSMGPWQQGLTSIVELSDSSFPFVADFEQTGVVPLPAALPLMVSGLAGLAWLARRRVVV